MKAIESIFKLIILLIIFALSSVINAQNEKIIDSLNQVIKNAKHDTVRIKAYIILGEKICLSDPDSALIMEKIAKGLAEKLLASNPGYVNTDSVKKQLALSLNDIGYIYLIKGDYNVSLEYFFKCNKIHEEIGNKKGVALALNNIGVAYNNLGNISKSIEYYNKSIVVQKEAGDKKGIALTLNNIGYIYNSQGDIANALNYFDRSLKIREEIDDRKGMAQSLNNIGTVYHDQGDLQKALEYHKKCLNIREELGDKSGIAYSLNNIGAVFIDMGNESAGMEYYEKSLKIRVEIDDKKGIAYSLNNIGYLYLSRNDCEKALVYYQKGLKINEETGDKKGISSSLKNIGIIFLRQNKTEKSKQFAEKAHKLALELGFPSDIRKTSSLLKDIYLKMGNYKQALEYYELEIKMRDSIANEDNFKKAMKQQARYEYEKKSATDSIAYVKAMEIKNLRMAKVEEEKKKQKIVLMAFILGFVIILVFSVVVFRLFIQKKKANIILAEQKLQIEIKNNNLQQANEEISAQRDEIEAQRDEIAAQRDLVTEQKEHIEEQKKEITDSITYAKRIQQAMLPDLSIVLFSRQSATGSRQSDSQIADCGLPTADFFVFFRPKDIVSGDFYWATRINEMLIITVADCTGHGVPGSFMSMLGISFLNEIVRKKEVTKTGEVLDHLRNSIIEALKQKGISGEQKDGMDIVFCVLNTKTLTLQFSGANNPLYIVGSGQLAVGNAGKDCQLSTANCQLTELKPDPQPVAIHINMKPFTTNEIQLQKGDCLYLTTDGYPDQFGGPKNKKFMIKRLKELFVEVSEKPMREQSEILKTSFEEWKGKYEQTDDITVMGIRI